MLVICIVYTASTLTGSLATAARTDHASAYESPKFLAGGGGMWSTRPAKSFP